MGNVHEPSDSEYKLLLKIGLMWAMPRHLKDFPDFLVAQLENATTE
jgi:hypothetical protein